ncbi:sugar transferase [Alkalicoccus halolimnae]|uniref:sugar transferase n=1 Tax=Alkalicoccus halolimnae TaxID=1667239 RepID=UPI003BAFD1EC
MKRTLDVTIAMVMLLVLFPAMIISAAAVKKNMGGPVLFKQVRPGKNEMLFNLYKFRTMTNKKDAAGNLLSDEERITYTGKVLRKLSLDELPQLWNVLKGDLSLVGPRPLLPEYLSRYSPEQKKRHIVRPGITGWAQVNGRNNLTWEEKFNCDLYYVENQSLMFDLKILFMTLWKVFKREGIDNSGEGGRPFMGSKTAQITNK